MNLRPIDLEEALDLLLVLALTALLIEWLSADASTSTYHAVARGDAPILLDDRTLDHLEDGGTIDVARWHGGTLTIEGYQTVDVDGEEAGG